jgi:choline transport protein
MMLIMLINLESTAALEAILSLSTVGLYLSYLMPITFFMVGRWRGTNPTDASFRLGRWGTPINLFALAFGIFMIIFLPFPSFLPGTWATMNYVDRYCLLSSFSPSWIGSRRARGGLLCPLRSMELTEKD